MRLLGRARTFMATLAFGAVNLFGQTPPPSTLPVAALTMAKHKLLSPMPEYPVQAKEAGIQGVVVLRAEIGPSGGVTRVELLSGDDRLGEAAKDAVRAWTYQPYLLNGVPVAVQTTITLAFDLAGPDAAPGPGRVTFLNPVRVSAGVMTSLLVHKVNPEYPPEAKAAGVSGSVVLHAFLSKTGEIERLSVISGPELLRDSALQAVRNWKYQPYLLNGEPVEVETQMTVNFALAPHS